MHVPAAQDLRLELGLQLIPAESFASEVFAGTGIIGAVSLGALLVVYRLLRRRLGAMCAIREALQAAALGERDTSLLAVAAQLGAEAVPWNALLAERQEMLRQLRAEQTRQALASRVAAKHDLDAAFDVMPQGLILVDENLRVRYANGAAAVFLQARRDEMNGAEVTRFVGQEEVVQHLRAIAAGTLRRRTSVEVEQKTATATTILRFTIRPSRREDSAAAMVMIEDITQQRVAAESRNNFVAQATHELRTPLTNIRLYVETAIDDGAKDPALRGNCLNVINQEARRLERIVGEMLSVAEIEAGSLKIKPGDVRADQLFADLKADFLPLASEKQIRLTFELPPKMPVLHADRDKLMVALHNVVGNALKYTPDGGQVTVTLATENGQMTVTVADTGIGISDEDAARIFERFYRAQDPRVDKITGSGLGLTLAREVARLHGGDINVQSQLNKGSTFTLTFPAVIKSEAA
jgi:PAS domain S-box-containing protein